MDVEVDEDFATKDEAEAPINVIDILESEGVILNDANGDNEEDTDDDLA